MTTTEEIEERVELSLGKTKRGVAKNDNKENRRRRIEETRNRGFEASPNGKIRGIEESMAKAFGASAKEGGIAESTHREIEDSAKGGVGGPRRGKIEVNTKCTNEETLDPGFEVSEKSGDH